MAGQRVNFKVCADAIHEAAKEVLSESEAREFVDAFERRLENFRSGNKLVRVEDKLQEMTKEMTDDMKRFANLQKRNALMSLRATATMEKHADSYRLPSEGLLGFLEDSRRAIKGAGRGVNAVIEGWKTKYLGELRGRLQEVGLWDDYRKDLHEADIFHAFYPEGSKNEKANKIKDIMMSLKQDMVEKSNLHGSFINFLPEHVKRTDWNTELIKKQFGPERFKNAINFNKDLTPEEYASTKQKWSDFLKQHADPEKTFKDADPDKFLSGAFDGIMSGKHGAEDIATGAEINTNFFKAGALAKKASVERLIHFKDGDSAYQVYKAMSGLPLSKGFVNELERGATNIGLMQMMGPNPASALNEAINRLEYRYSRSGENAKLNDLKKNEHKLRTAFGFLDRSMSNPANPTMHSATASVMSILAQAKLGKIALFALPDKALISSVLTRNGVGLMDSLAKALSIGPARTEAEKIRLMMMGAQLKSMIGQVGTRFDTGAESGLPGLIGKSQHLFFKMAGIEWLDNLGTSAVIGTLPRHLGIMADRDFESLVPQLKHVLNLYGITPGEWDAWRSTVYHTDKTGNIVEGRGDGSSAWVTPDRFKEIPDSKIDSLLSDKGVPVSENNRKRARVELEEKFRTWLTAQRDEGVLMPGSKEHRLATFGTQAGTPAGSLMRLLMMFKSFPITMITKIMRREMQGNGARTMMEWLQSEKTSNFHTTQLLAMTTIAGYLSLAIDDAITGKKPQTFYNDRGELDPKQSVGLLRDSFLRGGSGGLMADLLMKQYDDGYKNVIRAAGGPVANETMTGVALASNAARGQMKAQKAVSYVRGNLPYANLFYVKPALDHMIMYNIYEMLDPGYIRRLEQQTHRDNREYWLTPDNR